MFTMRKNNLALGKIEETVRESITIEEVIELSQMVYRLPLEENRAVSIVYFKDVWKEYQSQVERVTHLLSFFKGYPEILILKRELEAQLKDLLNDQSETKDQEIQCFMTYFNAFNKAMGFFQPIY